MFQCLGCVMRPGKLRIVSLSKRYIWCTSTGNGAFSLSICPDSTKFVSLHAHVSVFTIVDTIICLKMWAKQCPRMQKVHFCLKCLTQKCYWLSSLMMFSWLRQFSKMWWVWWVSFLFCKVFLHCPQLLSFRNRNYCSYLNKHPTSN